MSALAFRYPPAGSEVDATDARRVLVVDLDGTLLRTDLLDETFWAALSAGPRRAAAALTGLVRGRAALKAALAAAVDVDPALLPYDEEVVDLVRRHRAEGGRTVLCTAADMSVAMRIALHLGLFDEVHASDGGANLAGERKAERLVALFGEGGFDYVGDAAVDLPVWRRAGGAVTVGASAVVRSAVDGLGLARTRHVDRHGAGRALLQALRPHQWSKNLLVFVPLVAARETDPLAWGLAVLAFLAFSLVASGVYVLNDLLDLAADRAHPRKRRRPFAAGALPIRAGTLLAPALLGLGAVLAATTSGPFLALIAAYVGLTTLYSLRLKRELLVDIFALAALYTLRILGGGFATGIEISVWLLAFSGFFFLALAAVKRQSELVDGLAAGRGGASGRAYLVGDLPIMAMMALAAGFVSVLVMALYLESEVARTAYPNPLVLAGVCPVLLYWLSRMVLIAHRGGMHDDPIVFAVRDPASRVCGLLVAVLVASAGLP